MKTLTTLLAAALTIGIFGCSEQTSVQEPAGNSGFVYNSGPPVNMSGEVLVDEVVYSPSLKSTYRVSGTLIYDIAPKSTDNIVTTGLALSVENENPAKNEAYTLTAAHEQDVTFESKAPWFVSESHALGENPSATEKVITLTYAVNEDGLSIIQIQIEGRQIDNHW